MSITVEIKQDFPDDQWDRFVYQSVNGTIFHTCQFLSYHPKGRFEDASLIFRQEAELFALFPATRGNWTAMIPSGRIAGKLRRICLPRRA